MRHLKGLLAVPWAAFLLACGGIVNNGIADYLAYLPLFQGSSPSLISFNQVAGGFSSPVFVTNAEDGSGRLFVVEKRGVIRIVSAGAVLSSPFIDISDRVATSGERGLLSIAFPPGAGVKTRFYAYYVNLSGDIVIARFQVTVDPDAADPGSEEIILTVGHPGLFTNHNGGQLAFGGDGLLYAGTGDGGGAGDPSGNAQNPASNLGKLLVIDVEGAAGPYTAQISASGLRNPWRFSFDPLTGDLYLADVGQGRNEEINIRPAASAGGENYGWNVMEGSDCFGSATCDQTGLTVPSFEYTHSLGCSITGGYMYRGSASPTLYGTYLYGDFCSGRVWGLADTGGGLQSTLLANTPYSITSFGVDEAGEVLLVDFGGTIYRIAEL